MERGGAGSYADRMADGRVTLQDVADEAGLSKAATSYALRGLKGSTQTQELVRDIADRLGYTANPAAQALAGGRSGTVGVCGALHDLWHQGLAVALAGRLRAAGLGSAIADTDADPDRERELVEGMVRAHADGVVTLVTDPAAAWWGDLPGSFTVVSVGDVLTARPRASSVVFDNVHGVRTAMEHLAARGHRRIGLVTTTLPSSPGRPAEQLAGQVARERGVDLSVVSVPPATRDATRAVRALLAAPRRPTALFCLSDSIAFGAYRAAAELGLQIPRDLSILGYDDHDLADLVVPALSSFGWDEDAIAQAAIDLLVAQLSEDGDPEAVRQAPSASDDARLGVRVEFRPEFMPRSSTGPAPA